MDPDIGSSQSIEMMCLFKIKSRFSVESDRTIKKKKKKTRGKQTLQAFSGEGDGWLLTSRRQESLCRRSCFSWKRITKWRFTLLLKSHGPSLSGSPLCGCSTFWHQTLGFFFWEFSVRLSFLDTTVAAQMCNVTIHFHHGPLRPRQARSRVRWKLDLWLSNQHSNCGLAFCFLALTSLESIYPFLPVIDTHPGFIPPLELKEIPLHMWFPQL